MGILFLDIEMPYRIRFHGEATISKEEPLMTDFNKDEMVVRVKLSKMGVNCPCYVHKYELKELLYYESGQKNKTTSRLIEYRMFCH